MAFQYQETKGMKNKQRQNLVSCVNGENLKEQTIKLDRA